MTTDETHVKPVTYKIMGYGNPIDYGIRPSDVKVTCVPKDEDVIKQYFPGLPVIEWQPE
jgi:hypothetical protein